MPNIHVHLHDNVPDVKVYGGARGGAGKGPCGCTVARGTRDSDEGEGKWVTINGAHVHIGKGGKIDKGPKELMAKSEHGAHAHHHERKIEEHTEALRNKGKDHPDAAHHKKASLMHFDAKKNFNSAEQHAEQGNMKQARQHHDAAKAYADAAKMHEDEIGKAAKAEPAAFKKPAEHEGLHNDAADDVKGSDKHEAEHKRLLKEYDKSKSNWERNAINNQVAKNAHEGAKAKGQSLHHKALAASEHAKMTDDIEHHKAAREAIDKAREQNERAGGEGSQERIKNLDAMRKSHHAAVQAHEKANPSTSSTQVARFSELDNARKHAMQQDKPAKVFHHPDGGYFVPAHAAASGRHEKAGHKVALDYNGKPPAKKLPPQKLTAGEGAKSDDHLKIGEDHAFLAQTHGTIKGRQMHHAAATAQKDAHEAKGTAGYAAKRAAADEATRKANAESHQLPPAKKSGGGTATKSGGTHGGSALAKIAARHAKKAAEEAADQDPKHKK